MSGKMQAPVPMDVPQANPYEALGVAKSASQDEIKAAYRKLALTYHPDKNVGNEQAALKFQEISQAYSILGTPELRKKFDEGGIQALKEVDLTEVPIDVSQMGFMGASFLAMASKLGVPVKTTVSDSVHMAVERNLFKSVALEWGHPVTGKIGNSQAVYYLLDITAEHIAAGFVVTAVCHHCKVKLLLWDRAASASEWTMLCQEDAQKFGQINVAGIHVTGGDTLENVPKAAALLLREDPIEGQWFRVLDGVKSREQLNIKPGTHLIGVYGDNFFKKSAYTLTATKLGGPSLEHKAALEAAEEQLIKKRHELHDFEIDFKRARAEYEKAIVQLKEHELELSSVVKTRESAYLNLIGVANPASMVSSSSADGPLKGASPTRTNSVPAGSSEQEAGTKAARPGVMESVFKAASSVPNPLKRFWGTKKLPDAAVSADEAVVTDMPLGEAAPASQPTAQATPADTGAPPVDTPVEKTTSDQGGQYLS